MDRVTKYLTETKAGIDALIGKLKKVAEIESVLAGNGKRKVRKAKKAAAPKKTNGKVIHYRGLWGQFAKLTKGLEKEKVKELAAVRQEHGLKAAVAAAKKAARAD